MTDLLSKSSNEIFASESLNTISALSQQLSTDAINKKNELKSLVSKEYRNLLSMGDLIIELDHEGQKMDKMLYSLCFDKVRDLNVDRKITKFVSNESKVTTHVNPSERVINKSNEFIILSKFLSINTEMSVKEIKTRISNIQAHSFDQDIVDNKLKEIEIILIDRIHSSKDLNELKEIDDLNFSEFQFDSLIYDKLNELVSMETFPQILKVFNKFQTNFKTKIDQEINGLIDEISQEIKDLEASKPSEEPLDLYSLDFNEDYFRNINYISNGLTFKSYQKLNDLILDCFNKLKYLKMLELKNYETARANLLDIIQKFKTKGDQLLMKYLDNLQSINS